MQVQYTSIDHKVNNLFQQNLPQKIKCVDHKNFAYARIRNKENALKAHYLWMNPINSTNFLTVDIDRGVYQRDLEPTPNIVVTNKDHSGSHAIYILETPVHANELSSKKVQGYFNSIQRGVVAKIGGDPGYRHTFTKNPCSDYYNTFYLHERPWSLDHFREWVKPEGKHIITPDKAMGFGRNCITFEVIRNRAYLMIRNFKNYTVEDFYKAVWRECCSINKGFSVPLSAVELKHITKSITNWVWDKRFELTTFTKQVARAKKLAAKRAEAVIESRAKALELYDAGLKNIEIMKQLNISKMTLWRYLNN